MDRLLEGRQMITGSTDVVVTVPPRPEFVSVVRSVVASVAAGSHMRFDEIEDLRLAADEMCAHLLQLGDGTSTLTVSITPGPDELVLRACVDRHDAQWPPPGVRESLTWQLLTALADDVRFETYDGWPALTVTKRI